MNALSRKIVSDVNRKNTNEVVPPLFLHILQGSTKFPTLSSVITRRIGSARVELRTRGRTGR